MSPSVGVTSSTNLTCNAYATDKDGDSISYSYVWKRIEASGTTTTYSSATSSTLDLDTVAVNAGDSVSCTVTASDGRGGSDSGTHSVYVNNTKPTVTTPTVTPSGRFIMGTTLTCAASGSDAEDGSLTPTYEWYNGLTLVSSIRALTLSTSSGLYTYGDTLTCRATVTDSEGDTATSSTSNTINNLPSAPVIAISPKTPTSGVDDLVCTISTESSDADASDTVGYTFTWYNDGSVYSGKTTTTTHTGDTVPSTSLLGGEVWTCMVTPNDGYEDGIDGVAKTPITAGCEVTATYEWYDASAKAWSELHKDTFLPTNYMSAGLARVEADEGATISGSTCTNAVFDDLYAYDSSGTKLWSDTFSASTYWNFVGNGTASGTTCSTTTIDTSAGYGYAYQPFNAFWNRYDVLSVDDGFRLETTVYLSTSTGLIHISVDDTSGLSRSWTTYCATRYGTGDCPTVWAGGSISSKGRVTVEVDGQSSTNTASFPKAGSFHEFALEISSTSACASGGSGDTGIGDTGKPDPEDTGLKETGIIKGGGGAGDGETAPWGGRRQ